MKKTDESSEEQVAVKERKRFDMEWFTTAEIITIRLFTFTGLLVDVVLLLVQHVRR